MRCSDASQGSPSLRRIPIKADKPFKQIAKEGTWYRSRHLSICFLESPTTGIRIGLRIQKRVAHATDRNRIKRRLRFLFYTKRIGPMRPGDYIVTYRGTPASVVTLQDELQSLLKEIHNTDETV